MGARPRSTSPSSPGRPDPGVQGITDTNLFLEFTSDRPVLAFTSVINDASGDPFEIVASRDTAK